MRVDKAINIKEIKDELLKNPLQTDQQIADKLGVDRVTVSRLKREMSEIVTNAKNEDIVKITDTDREIIEMSQIISKHTLGMIAKKIENNPELPVELRDAKTASEIAKESTARFSLFRGNATDKDGGLKTIDNIDIL